MIVIATEEQTYSHLAAGLKRGTLARLDGHPQAPKIE